MNRKIGEFFLEERLLATETKFSYFSSVIIIMLFNFHEKGFAFFTILWYYNLC